MTIEEIYEQYASEDGWVPCSKVRFPEDLDNNSGKKYLLTIEGVLSGGERYVIFANYSPDLYGVDEYDFSDYKGKKHKGFYWISSECGYYEIDGVVAWKLADEPYAGK